MMASFAFGELGSGARPAVWGAGVVADDGSATVTAGSGTEALVKKGVLPVPAAGQEWQVRLEGLELRVMPALDGAKPQTLCHVTGLLTLQAGRLDIDCLGWLAVEPPLAEPDWTLLRWVAAWFSADDGLAVMALRPPRAHSHDEELVVAELLAPDRTPAEDPRLSTTYGGDGQPLRAGVELWLGEPEDDELHAFRAAGEAVAAPVMWTEGAASFSARLFRWHSRGREGAGVYTLGRRS